MFPAMSAPQIELFTAADYRSMPEDGKRYQLIEGEIIVAPAPNTYHQHVQRNLLRVLDTYLLQHPIGTVLGAPCDVYLDDQNVFQPDVLYVTREHATRIQHDGIHGAPDLVIEILSASTAGLDRRKRGHFAAGGTVEFWQIDPALRQLQRFVFAENTAKPIALIDEPETFSSPLFPDLVLATQDIFRR
jgi:Uma2 family endonuclease